MPRIGGVHSCIEDALSSDEGENRLLSGERPMLVNASAVGGLPDTLKRAPITFRV